MLQIFVGFVFLGLLIHWCICMNWDRHPWRHVLLCLLLIWQGCTVAILFAPTILSATTTKNKQLWSVSPCYVTVIVLISLMQHMRNERKLDIDFQICQMSPGDSWGVSAKLGVVNDMSSHWSNDRPSSPATFSVPHQMPEGFEKFPTPTGQPSRQSGES